MRGFNKAIIIGNLAKDPEIRYTASGTAVARLVVAVNRQWQGKDGEARKEVDFIPAVVWGSLAENCDRYLRKGSALLVEGRISVRNFEGRDGQKRYVTEIVVQTIQFLGGNRKEGESQNPSPESPNNRQPQQKGQAKSLREEGFSDDYPLDFSEMPGGDEEDIPF